MTRYGPGESKTLKVENASPCNFLFFSSFFFPGPVLTVVSGEPTALLDQTQKCHRWLGEADAHVVLAHYSISVEFDIYAISLEVGRTGKCEK